MIRAEQVHVDTIVHKVRNMQNEAGGSVTTLRDLLAKLHAIAGPGLTLLLHTDMCDQSACLCMYCA